MAKIKADEIEHICPLYNSSSIGKKLFEVTLTDKSAEKFGAKKVVSDNTFNLVLLVPYKDCYICQYGNFIHVKPRVKEYREYLYSAKNGELMFSTLKTNEIRSARNLVVVPEESHFNFFSSKTFEKIAESKNRDYGYNYDVYYIINDDCVNVYDDDLKFLYSIPYLPTMKYLYQNGFNVKGDNKFLIFTSKGYKILEDSKISKNENICFSTYHEFFKRFFYYISTNNDLVVYDMLEDKETNRFPLRSDVFKCHYNHQMFAVFTSNDDTYFLNLERGTFRILKDIKINANLGLVHAFTSRDCDGFHDGFIRVRDKDYNQNLIRLNTQKFFFKKPIDRIDDVYNNRGWRFVNGINQEKRTFRGYDLPSTDGNVFEKLVVK